MKKTTKDNRTGIRWTLTTQLEDLVFADDIYLAIKYNNAPKEQNIRTQQYRMESSHEDRNKKDKVDDNW